MIFFCMETNSVFLSMWISFKARFFLQEMAFSYQNLSCKKGDWDICFLGGKEEAVPYILQANQLKEPGVSSLGDYTLPGVQKSMDSQQ